MKYILIDAFNLIVGATIQSASSEEGGSIWVVTQVYRDCNKETIVATVREVSRSLAPVGFPATVVTATTTARMEFDYSARIRLVGLMVNPHDEDETNFGAI